MREYGPASALVDGLVQRAGTLTMDEAADVYRAHAARILIHGSDAERRALSRARRTAARAGLLAEYERARHAAATAWRHGLPGTQGPWLLVGAAIANVAGAMAIEQVLDEEPFQLLTGPWRQAFGTLIPVGPGLEGATRPIGLTRAG